MRTGRKLTQTGKLTLSDARALVALLETGDEIDPKIDDRVFRTKSSSELPGLNLIVEWAKAAGLVRVVKGRLLPVKKAAPLLKDPERLWEASFTALGKMSAALFPKNSTARGVAALERNNVRTAFMDAYHDVLTRLSMPYTGGAVIVR